MPEPPELSVIVATHNRLGLLRRKLEALKSQDLAPERFEVVVVADGCTDGTQGFLTGFRPPYGFAWLETPGVRQAKARNRAVERAGGAVLLLSDDDVLLRPDALRLHLLSQQTPSVCMGAFRYETGEVWRPRFRGAQPHWAGLGCANTSVPTAAFRRVGGFWEALDGYGGEDLELGYRLHRLGLPFRYLAEAQGVHAGGPSMQDLAKAASAGRQAVRIYRRHGDPRLGLELGVWPPLLALKLALIPLLQPLLGRKGAGEVAYNQAAWLESRTPAPRR